MWWKRFGKRALTARFACPPKNDDMQTLRNVPWKNKFHHHRESHGHNTSHSVVPANHIDTSITTYHSRPVQPPVWCHDEWGQQSQPAWNSRNLEDDVGGRASIVIYYDLKTYLFDRNLFSMRRVPRDVFRARWEHEPEQITETKI